MIRFFIKPPWWAWLLASVALGIPTAIESIDARTWYNPGPIPGAQGIRLNVQWAIVDVLLLLAIVIGVVRLAKPADSRRDMKLPQFSVRTLLIVVTLLAIAMGWVMYQLDWIRQRHEFLRTGVNEEGPSLLLIPNGAPWSLRLFGEYGAPQLYVNRGQSAKAKSLFPEATVFGQD